MVVRMRRRVLMLRIMIIIKLMMRFLGAIGRGEMMMLLLLVDC